jgi:hypothetical protein
LEKPFFDAPNTSWRLGKLNGFGKKILDTLADALKLSKDVSCLQNGTSAVGILSRMTNVPFVGAQLKTALMRLLAVHRLKASVASGHASCSH